MWHKRHKRKLKRRRHHFQPPPKPLCKIEDLPEDEKELMRVLILHVIKSYPVKIFEGTGLEKTLETTEHLINLGWIKMTSERTFTDPVGYNDENFYSFRLWHPILHKYVVAGSPETLHNDPRDHWPDWME